MEADNIINNALNSGGKMIAGKELFILEAHPERNEFRAISADECFSNNLAAFTYGINTGYIMLGMYTSKETAEEQIDVIRKLFRDENGNAL